MKVHVSILTLCALPILATASPFLKVECKEHHSIWHRSYLLFEGEVSFGTFKLKSDATSIEYLLTFGSPGCYGEMREVLKKEDGTFETIETHDNRSPPFSENDDFCRPEQVAVKLQTLPRRLHRQHSFAEVLHLGDKGTLSVAHHLGSIQLICSVDYFRPYRSY
jgi:hypothetical protein